MTSSFLDKKPPKSLVQQGLEGSTPVGKDEVGSSNLATRTMRSVLIGFEYPVTDTPYFCFLQNLYCNLCRGVADSYAFSRFHDNVGLRDFLAVWHFKGPDAVVVDDHLLIGHAILLFGVVHINVVNEFGYHAPGDFRHMGVPPHRFQKVLHIHLLAFSLFQFQPQSFDLCADFALFLFVPL